MPTQKTTTVVSSFPFVAVRNFIFSPYPSARQQ
jgi:hypothetical protein